MKQFGFGIGVAFAITVVVVLISRMFVKKRTTDNNQIGDDEKTKIYNEHIELMKQVYEKNPEIKTKKDALKELNRYRNDN